MALHLHPQFNTIEPVVSHNLRSAKPLLRLQMSFLLDESSPTPASLQILSNRPSHNPSSPPNTKKQSSKKTTTVSKSKKNFAKSSIFLNYIHIIFCCLYPFLYAFCFLVFVLFGREVIVGVV